MVTYTGQISHSSASDENDRVLLQVVADTGNVGRSLQTVGKSHSGDFTERRVRLFGVGGGNLGANASFLGRRQIGCDIVKSVEALLKHRCFGLVGLISATLSD